MLKKTPDTFLLFAFILLLPALVSAQPTWTIDPFGKEKKPEKYENRKLGSEKTADKKFTVVRNFYQNTITHYNYYFNANNRVNMVLERAKMAQKDDYSILLPFYPYTLSATAAQKSELDSVIYTSTAGILLHDLRNDWIDNMYMLIGKAYFLRNDMDSALMTFQFINYNLFPRKRRNDDDDRVVGTNASGTNYRISIANKEKRNILQKVASLPPSRNDALLWLTRTLIERDELAEAAGMINTLQNDPNLPKRLQNDLHEITAYWFYKQGIYDSSAVHLEKALTAAENKQDKARWEFLLAQMYEMGGNYDKASDYYSKASKHTVDPLLDIYAQLNEAKMMRGAKNPKELDKSIANLLKMGKRDKFEAYRDIVYYSAGQLALQKPDTGAAINYFNKSLKYNESNINYRNKAFLQLGDIAYDRKQYRLAAAMYDSLQTGADSVMDKLIANLQDRKNALTKIAEAISQIEREDSLQHIASMQPAERDDFVKKLVKRLRKASGLKDEGGQTGNIQFPGGNNQQSLDLFAGNSNTKGEWYFANSSLKSRGFSEFKSRWGNRANQDNWRRKSSSMVSQPAGTGNNPTGTNPKDTANKSGQPVEITYDALIKDVPLTPEKLAASNDNIASNMVDLAKAYQNDLEEYQLAADTYEEYLKRFPDRLLDGEIYLGLYFCYTKLENKTKAAYYKNLLDSKFPNGKASLTLNNPARLNPVAKNPEVTKLYDDIYTLFIEGNVEKAMLEKRKADSLYGVNYWTPQLLYIEALQHVKNKEDSLAIVGLQAIIDNNPNSPLKAKAANMIDVLKRRAEIEKYLTELQVTRMEDDKPVTVPATNPAPAPAKPAAVNPPPKKDSVATNPPPVSSGGFTLAPGAPHHVIMLLDKVDGVYVNEARNAFNRFNRENFYGQPININKDAIDAERSLLVISAFPDAASAMQYYDKIKRSAASEVSWLPANKYSFMIITEENLQKLKANKDVNGYRALLNTQFPGRF
ncbi:MAG TPA: tetratricopeptide repeat protein [Ferruginibacter sp.]|nr:tetratricopeptide repeat protein [Ferruginibacter sp.]